MAEAEGLRQYFARRAVCTHCNNVWTPVRPMSKAELRDWPKSAVCPRCGYYGTVRANSDDLYVLKEIDAKP